MSESLAFMQSDAMVFATDRTPSRPELRLVEGPPTSAATTIRTPTWQGDILNQLTGISALVDGWDSHGANAVSTARLIQTYDLLCSIMQHNTPPPTLVPTTSGSIQIEWHTCDVDLEILLLSDTDLDVDFEDRRSIETPYQGTLSFDITRLERIIHMLSDRARDAEDA